MKFAAIIVAAGSSRRMGFDKLLAPLAGKPVLQRSIEAFDQCDSVSEIVLVCPEVRAEQLDLGQLSKPLRRVDGGYDRHDSVAAGLELLTEETIYVSVHDGARPLITQEQIEAVFRAAQDHQSACSARPVTETVKRADCQGLVIEAVDRENLWLMETPQIFQADLLHQAYQHVMERNERVTDEVSAMELIGHPTYLVANASPNPKITYPQDIEMATKLLTIL